MKTSTKRIEREIERTVDDKRDALEKLNTIRSRGCDDAYLSAKVTRLNATLDSLMAALLK